MIQPASSCGTTIDAAQKLGRAWIGIDITHLAITLIKNRLADTYGAELKMKVIGEPEDLSGARELAAQDKYQFQWWALGLVGARPVGQTKGADGGVDGKVFFLPARRAEGNVAGAWSPLEAGGTTGSTFNNEHAPRQGARGKATTDTARRIRPHCA